MSFHNYEKKVNRKTNKIRQVIDDQKKYKMQRKETLKKKSIQKRRKRKTKPTFSMKKHDLRQFLLIFRRNFPQQRQENATYSLIKWLHNIYRKTKRLKAKLVSCKEKCNTSNATVTSCFPNNLVEVLWSQKSDINYPDHVFGMLATKKTHFS